MKNKKKADSAKKNNNKTIEKIQQKENNKNTEKKKDDSDIQYTIAAWLKFIFAAAICLCIGIPAASRITTAKDEDFDVNKGFDDTQQDKVWATYNVTDWDEVGGLQFSDDSLIVVDNKVLESPFVGDDDKKSTGKDELGIIEKELKKYHGHTYFKKENYRKLFLCMAYALNKKGYSADWAKGKHQEQTVEDISNLTDETAPVAQTGPDGQALPGSADVTAPNIDKIYQETQEQLTAEQAKKNSKYDVMFLHEVYNLDDYPKSKAEGYRILISKYFAAETAYLDASKDIDDMDYSINDSTSTEGLSCILQATIYGTGYIRAAKKCEYSEEKSKKYREDHPNSVNVEYDDFPEVILDKGKNIFGKNKQALYSARPIENVDQTTVEG